MRVERPRTVRRPWQRTVALAVCVGAVLLVAGCGVDPCEDSRRGLPEMPAGRYLGEPFAVWTAHPERFAVVLYGSSSCPPKPESLDVAAPDELTMTLKKPGNGPCIADLAPTTYEFKTPEGVDTAADIDIRIGARTLVLEAAAG